jgi:hypothetical protein
MSAGARDRRWLPAKKPAGKTMTDQRLDREESIRILEEIAPDRDAYPVARITAIRTLLQMADDEDDGAGVDDELYADELAARRRPPGRG